MEWRDVPGWEGYYQVSDTGIVRSVDRLVTTSDDRQVWYDSQILKQYIQDSGHHRVTLHKNGKSTLRMVSTLVLEAFVGERPDSRMESLHGDGNPSNNHFSNLRWGTSQENKHDTTRHGRDGSAMTHCKRGHEYTESNTRIRVRKDGRKTRVCLTCQTIRWENYRLGIPS